MDSEEPDPMDHGQNCTCFDCVGPESVRPEEEWGDPFWDEPLSYYYGPEE